MGGQKFRWESGSIILHHSYNFTIIKISFINIDRYVVIVGLQFEEKKLPQRETPSYKT